MYDLLGRLYMRLDKNDLAEEAFKQAIEVNAHVLSSYLGLGTLYAKQHAYEQARQQYESLIKDYPRFLPPYMQLGVIYDLQGQPQKANEQYEQVLKIDPKFAPAANNLAWNYAEHGGNLDVALTLAQTAKEQVPDDPSIADTLGWIYYKKGVYRQAIGLFKESAEKQSDVPAFHYHLGMAYYKNGDKALAKQALSRALQLSPDFSGAREARDVLASL